MMIVLIFGNEKRNIGYRERGDYMVRKRTLSSSFIGVLYSILFVFVCVVLMDFTSYAESILQLRAHVEDNQSVCLLWESGNTDSTFEIYRRVESNGTEVLLATLSGQSGTVKCYDHNVTMGKTYYYRIVQKLGDQLEGGSELVKVKVVLPTPVNCKTKVINKSRVRLTWKKVGNAYSYTIYRSQKSNGIFRELATTKDNSYVDYNVSRGHNYYYRIVANHRKNKAWQSEKSQTVSAHLNMVAPVVLGSYTKKKIKLTWKKIPGADSYYVYKKNSKGKFELVKRTSKLHYIDSKVKRGKSYTYKILAIDKVDGVIMKGDACAPYTVKALEVDPNKKMIALTYDDGPGMYTEDIVRCLKDNQAKATFFVLGCNIEGYKSAMRAADKIGCEIGNHTYNHPMLHRLSAEEIKKEIDDTDKKIEKVVGSKATLMRPPGGALSSTVEQNVGKPIIMWSIDTRDWEHRNANRVISSVMNHVQDGDIVLMHDIYQSTRDASLVLIPRLRREGYQLVTVSELAQYRGYSLEKGKKYNRLRKNGNQ